jgi:F-type H+-transporting ATPase subunit a
LNVLEEFARHYYWKYEFRGIDLSITQYVLWMLVSALIVFLFFFIASRRPKLVPSGIQNIAEVLIEFVRNSIILEIMGEAGLPWFPFIGTIFFFILFINLLGLVPHTGAATSRISTTAVWAVMVFVVYHAVGIKSNGLFHYLKSFVPPGVPIVLVPFMIIIEIFSHLARPLSLAVRLFANMLAGHMVLGVFLMMAATSSWWIKLLPFGGALIMNLFEVFVGALQAYIFTVLTAIYIGGAMHPEH